MKKRMNGYLWVGLIMAGFMVAMIIVGAFWTPYDPNAMAVGGKFEAPSLAHLLARMTSAATFSAASSRAPAPPLPSPWPPSPSVPCWARWWVPSRGISAAWWTRC